MRAHVLLQFAHKRIHEVADPLTESEWDLAGVCGEWSTKQVVAHLTGWAAYFEEFLAPYVGQTMATPLIDDFRQLGEDGFNAKHGTPAAASSAAQVMAAYDAAWRRVLDMAERIPPERWTEPGALPWDPHGSLDEFAVYAYFGHQYEHAAQIETFHDRRRRERGVV